MYMLFQGICMLVWEACVAKFVLWVNVTPIAKNLNVVVFYSYTYLGKHLVIWVLCYFSILVAKHQFLLTSGQDFDYAENQRLTIKPSKVN